MDGKQSHCWFHPLFLLPCIALFLLACLACPGSAAAQLAPAQSRIYPVPAAIRSNHFQVTINGRRADVSHAASAYYFLNFDIIGNARISITAPDDNYWKRGVDIQPWRLNIRPVVQGRTISFTLHAPAKLSVERPGDHFSDAEMLFLFANSPEGAVPTPATAGVRYYKPGVYHENIDAHSGDIIYLAPGAVVFGGLNFWQVENVRVRGRGVLVYDGPQDPTTDQGWMHRPNWHCIVMDSARNIEIDGITCVVRSRTWMIQMKDSRHIAFNNIKVIGGSSSDANQDGMDWLGGGDTAVRDSFFRAADDVFALQGNWDGYSQEAMLTPGHDVSNISIENSVVSTSISNIVRVNWPQKIFNSSNFIMRNVDVLHMGFGSCGVPFALLELWADPAGKGEHTNYRLQDIRLDDWYSLLQLRQPNPAIHDITLDHVWAIDTPTMAASVLSGDVTEVTLNDININRKIATRAADIPLEVRDGAQLPSFSDSNTPLTAAFAYSKGILAPKRAIVFDASASTGTDNKGGLAYEWSFGDGHSGTGLRIQHAFPDEGGTQLDGSGRFRVLLKVTDPTGHAAWTARSVVVASSALPAVKHSASPEAGFVPVTDFASPVAFPAAGALALPRADGPAEKSAQPTPGAPLVFDAYLRVPEDGGYTFFILYPERDRLTIDSRVIATGPKPRAQVCGSSGNAVQPAVGSVALKAGLHRIHIETVKVTNSDGPVLWWEGPNLLLSRVPQDAYLHGKPM